MALHRISITHADRQAMLDLAAKHHIKIFDHGVRFDPAMGWTVGAFAPSDQIDALKKAGYAVAVFEDVAKHAKARRKEVGTGPYVRKTRPR